MESRSSNRRVSVHLREFGKTETQKLHFVFKPRPQKGKQAAHYSVSSIVSLWDITVRRSGIRRRRPYQLGHTYACWMLSADANPAFIVNQMGHENADMVFHVYSAWINALASDQVSFLNQRFGGYTNATIVSLKVKTE
nr:tyrosine-type recombinase/integrase [Enterobacter mori]